MDSKKPIARVISFNKAYEMPVNDISVKDGYIKWGKDNNYPDSTFEKYNYTGSSTSKSIINKKNKLITGKGFEPIVDPQLNEFVEKIGLEKEIKKVGLDYEIINGFAYEIIWSNDGSRIASIKHIPIHKLRIGIEDEEGVNFPHFWYSDNWEEYRKEAYTPVPIRAFNPYIKQGKQIYVHYEYNPYCDVYPVESYSTAMNWIEMDYEISKFHINQIKQGYHPSFILNFSTGIPNEEEMDEFYRDFENRYQGSDNAGNFILAFSDGFDNRPELTPIQMNDSDDRFQMLMEQSEIQIARGHEIPVQMVVTTPGKLASSDERKELMAEFQVSYVTPRQEALEECLNYILQVGGYNEPLKLAEYGGEDAAQQTITDNEQS